MIQNILYGCSKGFSNLNRKEAGVLENSRTKRRYTLNPFKLYSDTYRKEKSVDINAIQLFERLELME